MRETEKRGRGRRLSNRGLRGTHFEKQLNLNRIYFPRHRGNSFQPGYGQVSCSHTITLGLARDTSPPGRRSGLQGYTENEKGFYEPRLLRASPRYPPPRMRQSQRNRRQGVLHAAAYTGKSRNSRNSREHVMIHVCYDQLRSFRLVTAAIVRGLVRFPEYPD